MNFATVLPLAFATIAGPQIISAIFFATSEKWKGDSATFVAGAAIAITTIYTAAYFIFKGAKQAVVRMAAQPRTGSTSRFSCYCSSRWCTPFAGERRQTPPDG